MAKQNSFMDMIDKGVNNTEKEGIMMARDDRIGTLMNLLEAERMSDNPDLDKIREYEGELFNLMSPRKASEGGDAKEENPLRQFRDDYETLIGFPSEVLREETKVMMNLLDSDVFEKAKDKEEFKKVFYDEYAPTMKFLDSLPKEERKKVLDIILSKRAEREIDRTEAEGVESLMSRDMAMADGGIVKLMKDKKDK